MEPYYFKGIPSDIPETVAYGSKMDALRVRERKYLWDGTFRDAFGATVTDEAGRAVKSFSRFEAADGTSALVICNYTDQPVTVSAALDMGSLSRCLLVDETEWKPYCGALTIPPRSAAVLE